MAIFLADESVDFRIVTSLRDEGYHIEAILEMTPSISDERVLNIANELEAILLTEDKDFGDLTYRLDKPNHGIILIRMSGIPIQEKTNKIIKVLKEHLDELAHSFTVISSDKVRIKKRSD